MSFNFSSPLKKQPKRSTWGNYIDVYETLVAPIVVIVATRMDKPEGAYITPIAKAFDNENEGNDLPSKWKLLGFVSRKGLDETQGGVRNAMLKGPESNYEWEAMIGFVDTEKKTSEGCWTKDC